MKQSTAVINLPSAKRFFLVSSFMLVIASSSAWASGEPKISKAVKESFNKEFMGAKLLEWSEEAGFLKATFILGDHRTQAFFKEDGQLQGSIRTLFYNQLPLAVMTAVDKRFSNAEILDVNEINNSLGTAYTITLEAKHKKYRLRLGANGNINDIERLKK